MTQQGFSLIELMVVIVIIAILSALGIPAYQGYLQKAAMTDMLQSMSAYKTAVDLCSLSNAGLEGCNAGSQGNPHAFDITVCQCRHDQSGCDYPDWPVDLARVECGDDAHAGCAKRRIPLDKGLPHQRRS